MWSAATVTAALTLALVAPAVAAGPISPIVARAGKVTVSAADVLAEARSMNMMHLGFGAAADDLRREALEKAIDSALVAEDARATGLLSSDEFRQRIAPRLDEYLAGELLQKAVAGVKVTPEMVKKALPPTWDVITLEMYLFETREAANEGRRVLLAGGRPAVASQTLAAIEWGRSNFDEATDRALFALKKGEISEPLPSGIGWMVVTPTKRETLPQDLIKTRREQVESTLRAQLEDRARADFLQARLREHHFVLDTGTFMSRVAEQQGDLSRLDGIEIGRFDDRVVRFKELRLFAEEVRTRKPKVMPSYADLAERLVRNAFYGSLARAEKLDRKPEFGALEADLRLELIVRLTRARLAAAIPDPTEAELRAQYDSRPGLRHVPEEAVVRYLWTSDRSRAEVAASRAKAGEDFGALIKEYSDDPGKLSGGAPSSIPATDTGTGLAPAIFAQKAGTVTGLVAASGKYFVIEVQERHPARDIPFADIRQRLFDSMRKERLQAAIEAYLKRLRARVKIVVDEKELAKVSLQPPPGIKGH
jgi:parvulin-like peptidyl-prolyl isomerase